MKKVNSVYSIIKEVAQTENSILYKAENTASQKKYLLKFLNKNVLKEFPRDFFIQDFKINTKLNHPSIRKVFRLESVFSIDGAKVESDEIFYVCEYLDFENLRTENRHFIVNYLENVLKFLHHNNYYHGDLKESNIYANHKLKKFKMIDISPFYDSPEGKKSDILNINNLFQENFNNVPEIDSVDTMSSLEDFDKKIHTEIINEHLRNSNFPAFLCVNEKELQKNIRRNYNTFEFKSHNLENAEIISKNLMYLFQSEGFYSIDSGKLEIGKEFNLLRKIISILKNIDLFKTLIDKNGEEFCKICEELDFKPTVPLSSETAENRRLKEFAYNFISEVSEIIPIALYIQDYSRLDRLSKDLILTVNQRKNLRIKIIYNSDREVPELEHKKSIKIGLLSKKEFKNVMSYFFYLFPFEEEKLNEIFRISSGEISQLNNGIKKAGYENAVFIKNEKLFLEKSAEYYFDFFNKTLKERIENLQKEEKDLLSLFKITNDYFSALLTENLTGKMKNNLEKLQKKELTAEDNGIYTLRFPIINEIIFVERENLFLKDFSSILEKIIKKENFYLESYLDIKFLLQEYNSAFKKLWEIYTFFTEEKKRYDFYLMFNCFEKFIKVENEIENKFDLYLGLASNNHNNQIDWDIIIEKLDEYKSSEKDEFIFLSYRLAHTVIQYEDLKDYYYIFDQFKFPDERYWCRTVKSILDSLKHLGYFDEALSIYREKLASKMNDISLVYRFSIYNCMFLICREKRDDVLASEFIKSEFILLRKHPEKIPDNFKIAAYNNRALLYGDDEREKAVKENIISKELAKKNKEYYLVSVISNNLAIDYYFMNHMKKAFEQFKESAEYSLLIHDYSMYSVSMTNLMELYSQEFNFKEILKLIKELLRTIENIMKESSRNRLYLIISRVYGRLGYYEESEKWLMKSKEFYEKKNKNLTVSFPYHYQNFFLLIAKGKFEESIEYVESILSDKEINLTRQGEDSFLIQVCEFLFVLDKKEILTKYTERLIKGKDEYETDLKPYVWFCGLDNLNLDSFHLFSIDELPKKLAFLYTYLQKTEKISALYTEFLLWMTKYVLNILEKIPEDMLEVFKEKNAHYRFYRKFLEEHGINLDSFDEVEYINNSKDMGLKHIKKLQTLFYRQSEFSTLLSADEVIKKSVKDILEITGLKRGIYFEFSRENGWKRDYELFDKMLYTGGEKFRKQILNELLIRDKDELKVYDKKNRTELGDINYAICFPVIDITTSRATKVIGTSSFKYLMNIKGALYFDTKCHIIKPDRHDLFQLFFLREFINITIYSNFLKDSALLDDLTKLFKRENWMNLSKEMLKTAKESNKKFCVVLSDIDHFKSVNDVYGHKTGDKVLRETAAVSQNSIRKIDLSGRYGGEEFIFILYGADRAKGEEISDRIRTNIENAEILPNQRITVSLGLSCFPEDGTLFSELIEKADTALLCAKRMGRNRICSWRDDLSVMEFRDSAKIISNPSREKEKIDILTGILTGGFWRESRETILEHLVSLFQTKYRIEEFYLYINNKGSYEFIPYFCGDESKLDGDLPEKIGDNVYRLSERFFKEVQYGFYALINPEDVEALFDIKFLQAAGETILEKLIINN